MVNLPRPDSFQDIFTEEDFGIVGEIKQILIYVFNLIEHGSYESALSQAKKFASQIYKSSFLNYHYSLILYGLYSSPYIRDIAPEFANGVALNLTTIRAQEDSVLEKNAELELEIAKVLMLIEKHISEKIRIQAAAEAAKQQAKPQGTSLSAIKRALDFFGGGGKPKPADTMTPAPDAEANELLNVNVQIAGLQGMLSKTPNQLTTRDKQLLKALLTNIEREDVNKLYSRPEMWSIGATLEKWIYDNIDRSYFNTSMTTVNARIRFRIVEYIKLILKVVGEG